MPTAKLLKHGPASYTLMGIKVSRGETVQVPTEFIDHMENQPEEVQDYFQLDRSSNRERRAPTPRIPTDQEAYGTRRREREPMDTGEARVARERAETDATRPTSLADAVNFIDVDDEDSFEEDTRPTPEALSRVMGRSVSEEERDKAFPEQPASADTPPPAATKTRIIKRGGAPKDPTTEGAQEV